MVISNENGCRVDKLKSAIVSAHVSTLPNEHDEDRFSLFQKDSKHFAFCVFDGHGGDYGSKLCALKLATSVYNYVDEKSNLLKEVYPDVNIDDDIYDTILCDAINKVTTEMNRLIKSDSATGTTFVGLFMRVTKDGSCHVICANIGDSRAVVHYNKMTAAVSEDHNLTLNRERRRIEDHTTAEYNYLPCDLLFPVVATMHLTGKPIELSNKYPEAQRLNYSKDLAAFLKLSKEQLIDQKEDIETLLIFMETQDIPDQILDEDMDASYHGQLLTGTGVTGVGGVGGTSSPKNVAALNVSAITNSSMESGNGRASRSGSNATKGTRAAYHTPRTDASPALDADAEFVTMQNKLTTTVVMPRKNKSGQAVGPEALFSRQGVSIMMTRSIGDRNAARTCVCVPDFTKLVIPKGEHARFMLGTDGMWDVMPNTMAMSASLKETSAANATMSVVYRAKMLREEAPMRIDDITCLIVDINEFVPKRKSMHNGSVPGTGEGGCCVIH